MPFVRRGSWPTGRTVFGLCQKHSILCPAYFRRKIQTAEDLLLPYSSPQGVSRPSLSTIAEEMGYCNRKKVASLVQSLEGKGMLIVTQNPGYTNLYDASPFFAATRKEWEKQKGCPPQGPAPCRDHEEYEVRKPKRTLPPIGGSGRIVVDLDQVAEEMEGVGMRKDALTARCECGASLTQEDNACPDCTLPVVWLNSRVWKKLYGDPRDYLRKLDGEGLKAETPLQQGVCDNFYYEEICPPSQAPVAAHYRGPVGMARGRFLRKY